MKTLFFTLSLFSAISLPAQDFILGPYQDSQASSYALGDFNGDGYEDVFALHTKLSGLSDLYIFFNESNEDTLFFQKTLLDVNNPATGDPDAADMDGDGDVDFVFAAGANLDLIMVENLGGGAFSETVLGVGGAVKLEIHDIDGDGDPDIAGLNQSSQTLDIFLNDGNQNFSKKNVVPTTFGLENFALGDFDSDGDKDIVAGYNLFFGNQVVLMVNDGNNNFNSTALAIGTSSSSGFQGLNVLAVGDLNQDGLLDIAGGGSESFSGWINGGNLVFQQQLLADYSGTSLFGFLSLALADFNGDGILDAALGDNDGPIVWYKNTDKSPLTYEKGTVGGVAPGYHLVTADFDKDEDIDIVVSNGEFWWYENNIEQLSAIHFTDEVRIDFFPNPVHTGLSFRNTGSGKYLYELFDINGERLLAGSLADTYLDLSMLFPGSYFLSVIDVESNTFRTATVIKN